MEVYLGKCFDYEDVHYVVREAFEALGGLKSIVSSGEKILVKPNLLKGSSPEKAVTTHPDFIIAVVKELESAGVHVIVGDSPGGPSSRKILAKFYKMSGWDRIPEETGAELNYDLSEERTSFPEGRVLKSIPLLKVSRDVDGVINLPKLKTHALTVFTGAVKNTYGVVPGLNKSAFHGQFRGSKKFNSMLMDVHDAVSPRLSIMDGVLGMDGDGPAGGNPVASNMVLASRDPYALDFAACKAVGIPSKKVPIFDLSGRDFSDIKYVKLDPGAFEIKFDHPHGDSVFWWMPEFVGDVFSNIYVRRPRLLAEKCISCGRCEEICPEDALVVDDLPSISWWRCIRCYCCAEICPEDALKPR